VTGRWQASRLWRATPTIALTTAVLVFLAGLAIALVTERLSTRQKVQEISVQARILASTVTAALSFNDRAAAQEYVDALQVNPEILQVAVYDSAGTRFAGYARHGVAQPPEIMKDTESVSLDDTLTVVHPVAQLGTRLGAVYVRSIVTPTSRRLARFAIIALLTTMVALVVSILGVAHATLSRANEELLEKASELATANTRLIQESEEREKAEAALRQAQKMEAIGHLTGGVAHDFNNLLQIILSSLSVLKRRSGKWQLAAKAEEDFQRYMHAAVSSGERAAALTRQLLAFARRQQLEPRRVDVNKLVAGMSELLRRALGESVFIQAVLAPDLWPIFADANQLESALVNLAVNARDAMGEGGFLSIVTTNATLDASTAEQDKDLTPGDYVMISVSDTGCGMSQHVLARVFEPFFTTKDIGKGTGLGLSQVYGFVKQSGGNIRIESDVGAGTTVRLYLPRLAEEEAGHHDLAAPAEIPRSTENETVLVVEDEEQVRNLSVDMLRELGYDVIEAADGAQALTVLESHPSIQLLFTDVGLPGGMNGRQLADAALQRRPELKVLFTSGYTRNAFQQSEAEMAEMLIAKPFSYAALAEKVRVVLGR
jgi:signal transduction histidine kinase/CheY-like chemotaxis protein